MALCSPFRWLVLAASCAHLAAAQPSIDPPAEASQVVWNSPSANSLGSMPIGNGDIAANVWVEPTGDLLLLLAKSDAYDEFNRLLKIGQIRIKTEPPLVLPGEPFRQTLNLRHGCVEIAAGARTVRVWIDANHPVVQADLSSPTPIVAEAAVEIWRTEPRMLDRRKGSEVEAHSAYNNFPDKRRVNPDVVLPHTGTELAWCHHNIESQWRANLELTGLEAEIARGRDPILSRTFGAVVRGDGMTAVSDTVLKSARSVTGLSVRIFPLTAFAPSPDVWRTAAHASAEKVPGETESRFNAHQAWWRELWERSWIHVGDLDATVGSDAVLVTQAYALQRFLNACAGRGALPIKFNGSLFTVDEVFDADYRRWGGPYWLQNTRLTYWSMLASGDYDLMRPLFRMLVEQLPLRQAATRRYFGHDGAHYPEAAHFWGNYADGNYGFDRGNLPHGITVNGYIRRHWVGIIELVGMMLDFYEATEDQVFRDTTLIPMAVETLLFYDRHWDRGADGKIVYSPSQSLETYFDTVDPTPDIAAMRALIPRLLTLPVSDAIREKWKKQLADQPEIPLQTTDGVTRILPARKFGASRNTENPELYPVFPFRLFTLATASDRELQIGINTYRARRFTANSGWQQGPIQAALLGLTEEAKAGVVNRSRAKAKGHRFPGFYGPNLNWTPDQDHVGVFQIALQRMVLQAEGDRILLLPAWPREWDVRFKLHAPRQTTVEGEVRDGRITALTVTPESRRKDVIFPAAGD